MEKEKENVIVTSISFEADILKALDSCAEVQMRSRSNMVMMILREKLGVEPARNETE